MNEDLEIEKKWIGSYRALQKSVWELELLNDHNPALLSPDDKDRLEAQLKEKKRLLQP